MKPRIPDAETVRLMRLQWMREAPKRKRLTDPTQREEAIWHALTVQTVLRADREGNLQLGAGTPSQQPPITATTAADTADAAAGGGGGHPTTFVPQEVESASSLSLDDSSSSFGHTDEVACCCICLDPYCVGDVVAWSNNARPKDAPRGSAAAICCLHVFHRECIVLWLTHPLHDDCPSCRTPILIVPQDDDDADAAGDDNNHVDHRSIPHNTTMETSIDDHSDHDDDDDNGSLHTASTYSSNYVFVIVQGLIARVRQVTHTFVGPEGANGGGTSAAPAVAPPARSAAGHRHVRSGSSSSASIVPTGDAIMVGYSQPSPFRRALSFGDYLLHKSDSTARNRILLSHSSCDDDDDDDCDNNNDDDDVERAQDFSRTTKMGGTTSRILLHSSVPLRRAVSAGPATPIRTSSDTPSASSSPRSRFRLDRPSSNSDGDDDVNYSYEDGIINKNSEDDPGAFLYPSCRPSPTRSLTSSFGTIARQRRLHNSHSHSKSRGSSISEDEHLGESLQVVRTASVTWADLEANDQDGYDDEDDIVRNTSSYKSRGGGGSTISEDDAYLSESLQLVRAGSVTWAD
jgi:hypothetical protein